MAFLAFFVVLALVAAPAFVGWRKAGKAGALLVTLVLGRSLFYSRSSGT